MFTAEKNLANFFLVIHTKKSMLVSQSETPLTAEMYIYKCIPRNSHSSGNDIREEKKKYKVNETIIHCRLDTKVLFRHS
jgi:hypothetical protein